MPQPVSATVSRACPRRADAPDIRPADKPIAPEHRHCVVAAHTLLYRCICLEPVRPSPQMLEPRPVPHDRVERRKKTHQTRRLAARRSSAWRYVADTVDDVPAKLAIADHPRERLTRAAELAMAGDHRLQRLFRRGGEDARVHHDERTQPVRGRRRAVGQRRGVIHPDAVLAPGDPQQSAPMQPLQRVRRRLRVAAPCVDDAALAEMRFERAWVRLAQRRDDLEHFLFECAERRRLTRMKELPHRLRKKPVGIEIVFLDVQRPILPLEIARPISANAMSEDEILRARRRSDGIGLDEPEPIDGVRQRRRCEERLVNRMTPQRRERQSLRGHRYSVSTFSPRSYRARSFGSKMRTTRSISYFGGQSSLPMSLWFPNRLRNAGSSHDSTRM